MMSFRFLSISRKSTSRFELGFSPRAATYIIVRDIICRQVFEESPH